MNPETPIQNKIRLKLSSQGILNFRNNTGALKDKDGRLVRYGLCVGSSDIIGIKPVLITPEMVGQVIGQFMAVEVKCPNKKPTKDQLNFGEQVEKKGGIFKVAYGDEDV